MKAIIRYSSKRETLLKSIFSISLIILTIITHHYTYGQPFAKSNQSSVDSIRDLLRGQPVKDTIYLQSIIDLAINTRNENIEQSQAYFKEAIALSRKLSAIRFQIRSLIGLGICYGMLDQYAEAIHYFNAALSLASENRHMIYVGDSYNSLGIVYKRVGDYPTSLSFYSKALRLYDSLRNEDGIASCNENMGVLFDLLKEPGKAMEHYQKSLAIYQKNEDIRKITTINSNVALIHLQNQNFQQAIDIYENNLEYYTKNNLKTHRLQEMVNVGYAYYKTKAYKKAETYLLAALKDAEILGMDQIRIDALYSLSKIRVDHGDFVTGIKWAKNAKLIADAMRSLRLRSKSHELLSYAFQKAGDLHNALEHFKIHKSFEDSLLNENKLREYKSHQVLMEVNEKDQQIAAQSLRLALLDKQIDLENKWNWTLGLASISLLIAGVLYYQKYRARIKHSEVLELQNSLITEQKEEIETINQQLEKQIQLRKETDDTINYFATSLFGKNTIDEILWDVAKNCISRLGLVDCVIYLLDESTGMLIQKAAYGTKNPEHFNIHDPIEIPLGKGIVGAVARSGVAEIVNDTANDPRYIIDDEARKSELAVPLMIHNKVIGIIDTEHPDKNFYSQYHLDALNTIASICASKIAHAHADERAMKAKEAQLEADQIKQLDQLKSHFFANISHEFRTPLNLILAPLQKKQPISQDEMEIMSRNTKRLLRLVNQMLDLAKVEVGLLKPEFRSINVFRLVTDIANSFTPLADAKGINYQIGISERDYIGYFDPDKLEKIIYNLLSNAFKFTASGGKVNINVSIEQPNTLRIDVSDNGIGISEQLIDKIFTRFYQVDASLTRPYEGSGIGLALTKELVDLLQGTVHVESVEGQGSVFTVRLPELEWSGRKGEVAAFPKSSNYYFEDLDSKMEKDVDEENAGDLPIILMVEDNMDLRTYVKRQLCNQFQILEAKNGNEGLMAAQNKIPDLIITDIMMPEMDGMTLTKHLRTDERTSHIPIILLTARDDGETKIKGFETGAEQYVVKPFEISELIARINSLLLQRERLRKKFGREITLQPQDIIVSNRDAVFLEKTIKIIENNFTEESFTVEQLQSEIGMSRMQLHRKLKALTNQSASDFVRTVKLKRAAQILRQPGVQVAEAAYLSGFSHMSYFSKCFKEQFGVLPSEYAKATADT